MKFFKHYLGIILIIIGTIALICTRMASLANSNTLLLSGFLLIVAGIWLHIHSIKHGSKY